MWEIEQSSSTTLVKIVAGRMLIIGVINLFLITVILISMAYIYQKSMIEMVLYGLIPFNISCTCYLFICAKSRTNDSLYHLIACMIFFLEHFLLYSISDLYLKRLCSGDGLDFMCYLLSY